MLLRWLSVESGVETSVVRARDSDLQIGPGSIVARLNIGWREELPPNLKHERFGLDSPSVLEHHVALEGGLCGEHQIGDDVVSEKGPSLAAGVNHGNGDDRNNQCKHRTRHRARLGEEVAPADEHPDRAGCRVVIPRLARHGGGREHLERQQHDEAGDDREDRDDDGEDERAPRPQYLEPQGCR